MIKSQLVKASTIAGFAVVILGAGIFWITHQGDATEPTSAVVSEAPASGKDLSLDTSSGALTPQSSSTLPGESDPKSAASDLGTCSINTPCTSPTPQAGSTMPSNGEPIPSPAAPATAVPSGTEQKTIPGTSNGASENSVATGVTNGAATHSR